MKEFIRTMRADDAQENAGGTQPATTETEAANTATQPATGATATTEEEEAANGGTNAEATAATEEQPATQPATNAAPTTETAAAQPAAAPATPATLKDLVKQALNGVPGSDRNAVIIQTSSTLLNEAHMFNVPTGVSDISQSALNWQRNDYITAIEQATEEALEALKA